MLKKTFILACLSSFSFAASSDLACKDINVTTFYGGYKDSNNAQKYVYFNGSTVLDITPPATSADKKIAKVITSSFVNLPQILSPYNAFTFSQTTSSNTNIGATRLSSLQTVPITTYYAGYIDSNSVQKYVYFNGSTILDITPPATSADKKVAKVVTTQFSSLPIIGTGNCKFDAALDGFYQMTDSGAFELDNNSNAIICSPKIQLSFSALVGGTCQSNTTPNNSPIFGTNAISSTTLTVGQSASISISNYASDIDGDTIAYSVSGLPSGLTYSSTSKTITGTPTTAGTNTVTITANDGKGGTATHTMSLTVNASSGGTIETPPQVPDVNTTVVSMPPSVPNI